MVMCGINFWWFTASMLKSFVFRTVSTARATLKDFTFSDGTFLPAGTHLAANAASIHHDELYYKDAHKFIPFRFVSEEGAENIKSNATTATSDFLAFGYGRHSWYVILSHTLSMFTWTLHSPGRYFAIIEIKAIMAQIILILMIIIISGVKFVDRFPSKSI